MMDAALGRKLRIVMMKRRRSLVNEVIVQRVSVALLGGKRVVAGTGASACGEGVGGCKVIVQTFRGRPHCRRGEGGFRHDGNSKVAITQCLMRTVKTE